MSNGNDKEKINVCQVHKANLDFDYYIYFLYHGIIEGLYIT